MIALCAGFCLIVIVQSIKCMTNGLCVGLEAYAVEVYDDILRNPPNADQALERICSCHRLGCCIAVLRVVRDAMYYVDRLSYGIFVVCLCWTTIMTFVWLVKIQLAWEVTQESLLSMF